VKSLKLSLILLAGSVAVSVLFWIAGFPFFFLFLFIPLIPFLSGPEEIRHCPVCGWETTGSERFCPYDATPLEGSVSSERKDDE
jgi:hypothetical protein